MTLGVSFGTLSHCRREVIAKISWQFYMIMQFMLFQVQSCWLQNKANCFFLQQSPRCCIFWHRFRQECKSCQLLAQQVLFAFSSSVLFQWLPLVD